MSIAVMIETVAVIWGQSGRKRGLKRGLRTRDCWMLAFLLPYCSDGVQPEPGPLIVFVALRFAGGFLDPVSKIYIFQHESWSWGGD